MSISAIAAKELANLGVDLEITEDSGYSAIVLKEVASIGGGLVTIRI